MSEARIQIQTVRFGELAVDQSLVVNFIEPILGFEASRQYILLDHAENSPFKWLQSLQDPELAFVVTNPQFFGIPYEFSLGDDAVSKLGLTNADDTLVLTIVNIPQGNPTLMTANLLGPLVINQANRKALQVVLVDTSYATKTRLLPDTQQHESNDVTAGSSAAKTHHSPRPS
ncbi:MAG: flagellar assembly protein FliW [Vampirovibrionales bacterium]|nr:flagellar assembly protein FliW [Vampirovibrionales bacterium]